MRSTQGMALSADEAHEIAKALQSAAETLTDSDSDSDTDAARLLADVAAFFLATNVTGDVVALTRIPHDAGTASVFGGLQHDC